jgi:hypothetical protein
MDFPQLRHQPDSLHHRITRRPSAFLGRHPPIELENAVRVGKPGIRQGVFWIELNRLLEALDGSPQRRRRALVPQVPPFQIKLISLDVARQREDYVWYQKGGQILYTLADYIGEEKLNLALHNFLTQYRYANANNQVDAHQTASASGSLDDPYPDTRLLVDAIRAQTPPELQYLIDDGFNRIVLYDNKAVSATSEKTPDGKYKVTLEVQARKVQADGDGAETPVPLADYIEIGVFSGKKDEEKPLYLKKEKLTEEHKTFEIIVDQAPTLAGIDPYNKLVDRNADDNMIDITRR